MRCYRLPRQNPLERRLRVSAALFAAGITLVIVWTIVPVVTAYGQAARNLTGIRQYEAILVAATHLSAERGPANITMSTDPGTAHAASRLAEFRRATDAALAALGPSGHGEGSIGLDSDAVAAARTKLANSRQMVDRVAATPSADRHREDVAAAIDAMIAAVDALQPAIPAKARQLAEQEPALAGLTLVAHAVSDLREFGGRVASYIIPAVSKREKLRPDETEKFNKAVGRLIQIDHLLKAHGTFAPGGLLGDLAREVQTVYFDGGLMLVTQLAAEGQAGGNYSIGAEALTSMYVPSLQPLEELRSHFIEQMIESVSAQRRTALIKLALVLLVTAGLVALMAALLHSLRRTVLAPLLKARDTVIALVEERERTAVPTVSGIAEIRSLFDSLAILSDRMDERRNLIAALKKQAETDALTGLSNRGAFEQFVGAAMRRAQPGRFCILYIDLDGFKIVNDTHGHHVGDTLLAAVALRLRAFASERVFIARIGGDEFAACCDGLDAEQWQALARALVDMLRQPFRLGKMEVTIGTSIGIAPLAPGVATYRELCQRADTALYQAKSAGKNTYREAMVAV